jgi:hypothetical protein
VKASRPPTSPTPPGATGSASAERLSTRPITPLIPAPDAQIFDTSNLTIEQAVDRLEHMVRNRQG